MSTICLIAALVFLLKCYHYQISKDTNHLLSIYLWPWASLFLIMSRYPWSLVAWCLVSSSCCLRPGPSGLSLSPLSGAWSLLKFSRTTNEQQVNPFYNRNRKRSSLNPNIVDEFNVSDFCLSTITSVAAEDPSFCRDHKLPLSPHYPVRHQGPLVKQQTGGKDNIMLTYSIQFNGEWW